MAGRMFSPVGILRIYIYIYLNTYDFFGIGGLSCFGCMPPKFPSHQHGADRMFSPVVNFTSLKLWFALTIGFVSHVTANQSLRLVKC